MEHLGTVRLETDRLILRRFCSKDYEAVFRNFESDTEMTKFLRWKAAKKQEEATAVVDMWISHYNQKDFYQWAILPKDLDEPIGTISVVKCHEDTQRVEIGYCIGSKWWNRGYTSEAFGSVITFLFEQVKVNRIEAFHDPNNIYSGKVMEKCGLVYEGTAREADWNNQGIVDAAMYGILASDYREGKREINAAKDHK